MEENIVITNARYNAFNGENCSISCTFNGQKLSFPLDPANRHYAAILEWAEEDGNEIQAAE